MSICYDWSRPIALAEASAAMYRRATYMDTHTHWHSHCAEVHYSDANLMMIWQGCYERFLLVLQPSSANIYLMTCNYHSLFAAAQETNKVVREG